MPFPKELPVQTYANGTMPVGTPVKVFEPFKAPAFTSPAVPVGGIVTSVTLQSTGIADQANLPFTFGHVFKKGDLAPDCALVGAIQGQSDLPLQVNVKATHDDGSVRHAIVSGVLPSLSAGASVVMGLKRSASVAKGANVPLPTNLPSAKLTIAGVVYTATPKAGDFPYVWLAGSQLTDSVANVPFVDAGGSAHPTLTAQFSVRAYIGGTVRADIAIEHCKAYGSTADITYDVTLSANGATVYSKTGLVHTPCARWKKQFWYGTAPALHIKHDTAYLIATCQVPNYDQTVKIAESELAAYAVDSASSKFAPMNFGRFTPYMPTTGGRRDIGIMPDTHVACILSMDKRAKDIVLAAGDIGGSWQVCRRDDSAGPGRGLPLSVVNFPYAAILGNPGDCLNPSTGKSEKLPDPTSVTQGVADCAHQPGVCYLPYLLTGDYFYLEGLQFFCAFNMYYGNPYYRQFEQALVAPDQVRGQAWSMRTLAEAAAITPDDHPLKQHFAYWYASNIAWYNARYTDGNDNAIGILTNQAMAYSINGGTGNGIACWQDDFFTAAIGHCVELLGDMDAKRLLMWKAKFQIGRMLDLAICVQDSCAYSLGVKTSSTSPVFGTLAECWNFTVPASQAQYACGSPQRLALGDSPLLPGDIDGYPGSTDGFAADYQPGLAAAVDSGYPNGAAAWAKFMARPTKPNYGLSAQFAIEPRAATGVSANPAPAPAPVPDPIPSPAPTPAPSPAPMPTTSANIVTAPTVAGTWVKVGAEDGTITVPSGTTVRYGYDGKYVYAIVSGTFVASNAFFGTDPAVGFAKLVEAFTPAVVQADPTPTPTPAPAPSPTPAPTVAGTIKSPSNTKLAGKAGLGVAVFNPSTLALAKKFTGLAASSKGVLTVKDAALVPGTVYAAVVADSTGRVLDVMYPLTAA